MAEIILFQYQMWLRVKSNYFEIILRLFQCFVSLVTTDRGYM